jgi:tetratricopeptide (TPR) repeat protein
MDTPPKVFISYSHDSEEHCLQVAALADRLRSDGVDCTIDRYETSPREGWPLWMERRLEESDFVLVVCTGTYLRRAGGLEAPGVGLGARFESGLIVQDLYDAALHNEKYIPIQFLDGSPEEIPRSLRSATRYVLDRDYETLCRHLTGQPAVVKRPVGAPRHLPSSEPAGRQAAPEPQQAAGRGWMARRWPLLVGAAVLLLSLPFLWRGWRARTEPAHPVSPTLFREILEEGRKALRRRDPAAAEALFEEALVYGDFPQAHAGRAEALSFLGRRDEAEREATAAERGLAGESEVAERMRIEAQIARFRGPCRTAREAFGKLHRMLPDDADAAVYLAEAELSCGQPQRALAVVAESSEPRDPRLELLAARAWGTLSRFEDQRQAASRAIDRPSASEAPLLAAEGRLLRGVALSSLGRSVEALADFEEASHLAPDNVMAADAQEEIGILHHQAGELMAAMASYQQALDVYRKLGDSAGELIELQNIASVSFQMGDLRRAEGIWRALDRRQEGARDRDLSLRSAVQGNLGLALERQGEVRAADLMLRSAVTSARLAQERSEEARHLCGLATAQRDSLQLGFAETSLLACRDRAVGNDGLIAQADMERGAVLFLRGKFDASRPLLKQALTARRRLGDTDDIAESLLSLAGLLLATGSAAEAVRYADEAIEQSGSPDLRASAQVIQARAALELGKPEKARQLLMEAQVRAAISQELDLRVRFRIAEAQWCAASGDVARARSLIAAAGDEAAWWRHPLLEMDTALAAGEIELRHGDPVRGRQQLGILRAAAQEHDYGLAVTRIDRLLAAPRL